jgi:hypothetical protein
MRIPTFRKLSEETGRKSLADQARGDNSGSCETVSKEMLFISGIQSKPCF